MELRFSIENQSLKRLDQNSIVNKTREYVTLYFSFLTEDWENVTKHVLLQDEEGKTYQFNLGTICEGTLTVPEVVLYGGFFKVSIFGIIDITRITTDVRTVVLTPSGYTTNISPVDEGDYSIDVYEDLNTKMATKADIIHSHDMDDVNGLENALDSKADSVHNHVSSDVTDLEDVVGVDVKSALNSIVTKIRTYGVDNNDS